MPAFLYGLNVDYIKIFELQHRSNWNNIMSYLLFIKKLFFLLVFNSVKFSFFIPFISIIPTLRIHYHFTTHSLPIQLTFTKDKNILSLLYGAFAEILRSNITPY